MRRRARTSAAVGALVELEGYDLTAVEPAALNACAEGLARLFGAIDFPLQMLVQRRRALSPQLAEPGAQTQRPVHDVAATLTDAASQHLADMLAASHVYRNRVYVALGDAGGDRSTRDRRLGLIVEMLRAGGLRPEPLDAMALRAAVWAACATAVACPEPARRTGEEVDNPAAGELRERMRAAIGPGGAVTALEMTRLPGRPVSLGWLGPLLAVATTCDISLHLEALDGATAHRSLERRLRGLTADRMLDIDRGRLGDPRVDAGLEAAEALRERLARNEVRPLRLSITVTTAGADERASDHGATLVRIAAAAAGLRMRSAHLDHAAIARCTVPGAPTPGSGKLVDSAAAATCLPLTETICDDSAGYRLGFARRSGLPVSVDVFDTSHHSNANLAVFATSGHGKSFTLGAVVMEAVAHGVGALIIDPEGEYERLMHACGGQYLRFGAAGCGALNVFDAAPRYEEAVALAVDLVSVFCGGVLGEVERALVDAALREAVARARARGSVPLLGDCIEELSASAPRAAAVLRRACGEPLGDIFNRPSDVDIDGSLCAVSLRDLPAEFVAAATLLIAGWMWTRVRARRLRQHIVLDEVGALCVHPPLRSLLVQLARRCRKHGASLVVATQNVEDLLRTEEGSVVATNCAVVLLGGHRAAEAAQMERAFGLTAGQRRFLEHAGRGEFLLLAGRRRTELRIDVPPLHRGVLAR